jgi:hypothetical protein
MLGGQKSRGYCLEMICADFLAGANSEDPNPSALSNLIRRFFQLLPSGEKRELPRAMREKRVSSIRQRRPRLKLGCEISGTAASNLHDVLSGLFTVVDTHVAAVE